MGRFFTGWRAAEPESALKAPSITSSPGLELTSNTSSESSSLTSSQPTTPPGFDDRDTTMPTTSPITIATPSRTSSSSPSSHGQKSNYHDSTAADTRTSAMMSNTGFDSSMGGRGGQNSFVGGAQPISMNNPNRNQDGRARRESLAGSLVNGMSWGGVSVGSWIRDDIMMTGTSPFHMQSPSYHSSSYLPKLEAEFMRNFACCGQTLPSLHDLLQHYEECHAESTPQSRSSSLAARARENSTPNSKAHYQSEAANKILQQQSQNPQGQPSRPQIQIGQGSGVGGISALRQQQSQPSTPIQQKTQPAAEDMDGVEDMEMDDPVGPMDMSADLSVKPVNQPVQGAQQSMFGQQPRPQLNLNSSGMQHSGLRNNISQPTTPSTSGFGFNNNPTVSSVNTPTLSAQPMQQQQTFSPDTSVPGTPAEYEDDLAKFPNIDMGIGSMNFSNINFPYGLGGNDMGLDLCIDEPAKRLYSPNGGFNNQQRQQFAQFAQFGLNPAAQAQFGGGANESTIRAYQIHQMRAMGAGGLTPQQTAAMMMPGEEHKPFKCPVIGCEKAYKNQNGLKYHKTHGHTTQQLHENGDGTFSIVNPETSAPYPGTLGMEKEKPYKCEVCGKRYKNLNGLKYHKQHSPPCNPELKLNHHMASVGLPGLNVNVAGFPGIPEEGMTGMM